MGTANWLARTASVSTLSLALGTASCGGGGQGTIPVGGDDASSGADAGTISFPTSGADTGTGTPTPGVDTGVPVGSLDAGGAHDTGTMTTTSADTGTGTGGVDATMPPVDSGATAAENEWLIPQNQARAAVGEAPLVWDPIAAAVATAYANGCDYVHNPNRQAQYDAMSGTSIYIGENIAAGEPTESVSEACSDWIAEKQYFTNSATGGTCDAPDDGECGHYTQIVWSTTTGVGCAQATCSGSTSPFGDGNSWVYSVCDYSPGGNIVGEAPY